MPSQRRLALPLPHMPSHLLTNCPPFIIWVAILLVGAQESIAKPEQPIQDMCLADNRCRTLAERGQSQYQAQQLDAALESFRAAYSVKSSAWLLFNIGRVHQKQGNSDEALAAYRTFLQQSTAPDEAWQREKARVYVENVERERTAAVSVPAKPVEPPMASPTPPAAPLPPTAVTLPSANTAGVAAPPNKPVADRQPLYKRWWLWTVVGVVVAGAVVGTALGVTAQEPSWPDSPQARF